MTPQEFYESLERSREMSEQKKTLDTNQYANLLAEKIEFFSHRAQDNYSITEAMLDWNKHNTGIIMAIPDFIMEESQRVCKLNFERFNHYILDWFCNLREKPESKYLCFKTVFNDRSGNHILDHQRLKGQLKTHIEGYMTEDQRELIKQSERWLKDECDKALVCSALYLLDNTGFKVGIVSDNTRDFNCALRDKLRHYKSGQNQEQRYIRLFKSDTLVEYLGDKGLYLPTLPNGM